MMVQKKFSMEINYEFIIWKEDTAVEKEHWIVILRVEEEDQKQMEENVIKEITKEGKTLRRVKKLPRNKDS